ncbi:MAG: orotidine-5'-phosphate decarboxylase [Lachnospirales bacterium]
MSKLIIDTLIEKIKEKENPTVVGLDPKLEFIPKLILEENYDLYGKSLKGVSQSFLKYNKMIIDEVCDIVPSIKPQIAMYEKYGYEGIRAYKETISYAKEKGMVVIADIKRGDISTTQKAYADAYLGAIEIDGVKERVFDADFATIAPYMGTDSIEPCLEVMKETNTGIFVLVKTSNPGSKDFQDLLINGSKLFEVVGDYVEKWGMDFIGEYGYSSVGAVVGGTHKEECAILRKRLQKTFFLIPGYGAQGGKAEDIAACFDKNGIGGIVNSSRGIIAAYKQEKYKDFGEENFHKAARESALCMKKDLLGCL